jgi:hypothetical protein
MSEDSTQNHSKPFCIKRAHLLSGGGGLFFCQPSYIMKYLNNPTAIAILTLLVHALITVMCAFAWSYTQATEHWSERGWHATVVVAAAMLIVNFLVVTFHVLDRHLD